jgi:hypothetical protein
MNLNEVWLDTVDLHKVAEDRDQLQPLVNTEMHED